MFHEIPLKLYFKKCSERNISHCIHILTFVTFSSKTDRVTKKSYFFADFKIFTIVSNMSIGLIS